MMTSSDARIPAISTADMRSRLDAHLDRVAEDSADSFPASDPPSWSPLRIGAPTHDSPRHQKDT
jgi:hypothetical protein